MPDNPLLTRLPERIPTVYQTAPPTTMSSTQPRLAYLDATRAFALVLGVVFHASLSFMPYYIGWAVQDESTHMGAALFVVISHSFRMELFFLLAGFFSHMTLRRKGLSDLIRSRIIRIVVPFLIGWFLLRPLMISGWIMGGASMRGDYEFWASIADGFQTQLGEIPGGMFVGTHLWFLYYIVLVSASVLVLRSLLTASQPLAEKLRQTADRSIAWLAGSSWTILIATMVLALVLRQMNGWGVDTPDTSLVPHVPAMFLYGGFFGLGWLLERQPEALIKFSRLSWWRVGLVVIAIGVVSGLAPIQMDLGHPRADAARELYSVAYALLMWTLVWLTIGLFRHGFQQSNRLVRYIADSSYWMYLIHLPIVIWLQVALAEVALNWTLKLVAIPAITVAIGLLTYDLFVRSTFIGKTLNGRRRKRVIFGNHSNS